MSVSSSEVLEFNADQALFSGQLQGMVAVVHENERPLRGLAGLLDWRFHGAISRIIKAEALTGNTGECAYIPVVHANKTYHLILAGGGIAPAPGKRTRPTNETLRILRKNIASAGISRIGISLSDFGNISAEHLAKHFKDVPHWIVQ
jgi:hypothetical protein